MFSMCPPSQKIIHCMLKIVDNYDESKNSGGICLISRFMAFFNSKMKTKQKTTILSSARWKHGNFNLNKFLFSPVLPLAHYISFSNILRFKFSSCLYHSYTVYGFLMCRSNLGRKTVGVAIGSIRIFLQ